MQKTILNNKGQGLIEYLILVAIMGIATIGIVRMMGHTVSAKFTEATYALQGKKKSVATDQIQESHYKRKDLSDFINGVGGRD